MGGLSFIASAAGAAVQRPSKCSGGTALVLRGSTYSLSADNLLPKDQPWLVVYSMFFIISRTACQQVYLTKASAYT